PPRFVSCLRFYSLRRHCPCSALLVRPRSKLLPALFSQVRPPTHIYTLSLHDALPIYRSVVMGLVYLTSIAYCIALLVSDILYARSEEHTSELQSRRELVCRLLLEKKKQERVVGLKFK